MGETKITIEPRTPTIGKSRFTTGLEMYFVSGGTGVSVGICFGSVNTFWGQKIGRRFLISYFGRAFFCFVWRMCSFQLAIEPFEEN